MADSTVEQKYLVVGELPKFGACEFREQAFYELSLTPNKRHSVAELQNDV